MNIPVTNDACSSPTCLVVTHPVQKALARTHIADKISKIARDPMSSMTMALSHCDKTTPRQPDHLTTEQNPVFDQ